MELYQELVWCKAQEDKARARRVELEQLIIAQMKHTKLEGTTTRKEGGYKVTVTSKVTRQLDYDAYEALGLPEKLQFVDLKPTINLSRMRMIETIDPELVQKCITIKPAKTQVQITLIPEE